MASAVTRIRVHVSSPKDVEEEREALASIVRELNADFREKYGILLELVRWEDSAVPAVGRPQEVINRQIPATDIFVGILWARFGTPLKDGDSGTEEEFRRAVESWKMLGRPHVLLYFCERPLAPAAVDIEQLKRIVDFRRSFAERGLFQIYTTVSQFRAAVRHDLTEVVYQSIAGKLRQPRRVPRLFYSYAHEDAVLREELAKHLRVLERTQIIESWYDNMIAPGVEWSSKIADELNAADMIIFLVSSDFLDSDYCYGVEMRRALERHGAGDARVIPVIIRSAMWEESPLASLKALPRDGRPVTLWDDRDEAWTDVARGIRRIALEIAPRT